MRVLAKLVEGRQEGKHNRLPASLADDPRPILGSVRNPWDWYVSLWGYSCGTYGGLYARQTGLSLTGYGTREHPWIGLSSILYQVVKPRSLWKHLYSDVRDTSLFRRWLVEMFNPKRRYDIGNGYAQSPLSSFSGYLTFQYMYLFARDVRRLFRAGGLSCNEDLVAFDRENMRLDHVIHLESLDDDLIDALLEVGVDLSEEDKHSIRSAKPFNASKRKRDLSLYYDERTLDLVAEREAFFIQRFGYQKPLLSVSE